MQNVASEKSLLRFSFRGYDGWRWGPSILNSTFDGYVYFSIAITISIVVGVIVSQLLHVQLLCKEKMNIKEKVIAMITFRYCWQEKKMLSKVMVGYEFDRTF